MKAVQEKLPGTVGPMNKEVHDQAIHYAEARDERMELSKIEKEEKTKLLTLMKHHKLTVYQDDDCSVEIVSDEKPKVKIKGGDDEEDE